MRYNTLISSEDSKHLVIVVIDEFFYSSFINQSVGRNSAAHCQFSYLLSRKERMVKIKFLSLCKV